MADDIPAWRKENTKIRFDLTPGEMVWRDRQKMLERHGYLLRPRFRPDWTPSWLNTGKEILFCEDSIYNPLPMLIDAKRLSDGAQVAIKAVKRSAKESEIASFLTSGENATDPTNHCFPVLDIIRDESLPFLEFIVMPLLRPFDNPPFFSVEEVIEFMKQALEGLTFMHKLSVAHRDCSDLNIMFDATGMYPKGFHPGAWDLDATGMPAQPYRRSDVPSVKYYFTDFGLSVRFGEGETRLVRGREGLDQEVPELSFLEMYDPFAVDICILGNVFKRNFLQRYTNTRFLSPLVERMTRHGPSDRPSAVDALTQFNELVSGIPRYARRWRLREIEKGRLVTLFHDVGSVRREFIFILKSFIAPPR